MENNVPRLTSIQIAVTVGILGCMVAFAFVNYAVTSCPPREAYDIDLYQRYWNGQFITVAKQAENASEADFPALEEQMLEIRAHVEGLGGPICTTADRQALLNVFDLKIDWLRLKASHGSDIEISLAFDKVLEAEATFEQLRSTPDKFLFGVIWIGEG